MSISQHLPTLTRRMIERWGGVQLALDAEKRVKQGVVLKAEIEGNVISGLFAHDPSPLQCRFKVLENGMVDSDCPCFVNRQKGMVCVHVVALALSIMRRQNDPVRQQQYIDDMRHAKRMEEGLKNAFPVDRHGTPASLMLEVLNDWREQFAHGTVTLHCAFMFKGRSIPALPESIDRRHPLCLSSTDETTLRVLEDISENGICSSLQLKRYDFLSLLDVCRGRDILVSGGVAVSVQNRPASLSVMMDLDRENGELLIFAKAGGLDGVPETVFPEYLVELERSWAFAHNKIWPLKPTLPAQYHMLYSEPIAIPRKGIESFIYNELPRLRDTVPFDFEPGAEPESFTSSPGTPSFELLLRGSQISVMARLDAVYGDIRVAAGALEVPGAVSLPDDSDLYHFFGRNLIAERRALSYLTTAGFNGMRGDGLSGISGRRGVLNVLGGLVPNMRRIGWRVKTEGELAKYFDSLDSAVPVVSVIAPHGMSGNFDVSMKFEVAAGTVVSSNQIELAIRKGESFLDYCGKTVLIDRNAVESMQKVFRDCESHGGTKPGHFTMASVYAPYVAASLDTLDGIDIELPQEWREKAGQCNRRLKLEPEPLGKLENILRPYQKDGVYWMRFLEASGFCGILADEMGLGKTLQTLAWLSLERKHEEAKGKPALIIAPTSLVENWRRECEKFTPWRKCIAMSGAGRHELWNELESADIVVTSYALIRRDIEHYAGVYFSVVVLDEAQQIKNRSTQNAVSVKQLRASCKLVLTGTPVENGLADIWSIMDFLMPGYLGRYDTFKVEYEQPISGGLENRDANEALVRLHRKLQPFLMRRLKEDVAPDLPAKMQQIYYSELDHEQAELYAALHEVFRKKILELVSKKGFDHCRMEVLAILLRLRQVCCHPRLLPREMLASYSPDIASGKMEQFFELLDDSIAGGHRMLVFSQFVGMLNILRGEFDRRGVKYCYLDGSTINRIDECSKFNKDQGISAFLISLKAGGTGLNLTGADTVVHFDPWWNPAVEDQATDRAHRIGQKRKVQSYKLITRDTVEEKVLSMQQKKQAVISATVGNTDAAIMRSLSWDDVKSLLE